MPAAASRGIGVLGDVMAILHLAVSPVLFLCLVLGKDVGLAVDAKDWPTYNGNVLGWRYNVGETALDKADVAGLEEKWRFPPRGQTSRSASSTPRRSRSADTSTSAP